MRIKSRIRRYFRISVCLLIAYTLVRVIRVFTDDSVTDIGVNGVIRDKVEDQRTATNNATDNSEPDNVVFANERCNQAYFPKRLSATKDIWLPVDSINSAFVFSAYLLSEDKLAILGAMSVRQNVAFCQLWYRHTNQSMMSIESAVSHMRIPEGRDFRYTAHIYKCGLVDDKVPDYVSIVTERCARPLHLLQIQNASIPIKPERNFTVCLSPLNTNYTRAYELIEWIELNRILGAQKFIIYNSSSARNVSSLLDFYSKQGIVEVVNWRLPMKTDMKTTTNDHKGEIYYYGQLAALNDCLYRQKHYSEFVVNIDLDEFIVPHLSDGKTWSDILKHASAAAGTYLFRNVFFRKDWTNEDIVISNKEKVEKFSLITLQKLEREMKVFPPRHRSKYFVRTASVDLLMIHSVSSTATSKQVVVVPDKLALLHHYRDWEQYLKDGYTAVQDETVPTKYGEKLLENVEHIWSQLYSEIT